MCLRLRSVVAVATLVFFPIAQAAAQAPIKGRSGLWVGAPLDEYVRLLQLTGAAPLSSRMLRPLEHELRTLALSDSVPLSQNPWRSVYGTEQSGDSGRLTVELYDPLVRITSNSAVPFGGNDGAMWAGRGVSGAITVGGAARIGPLTVRLAPVATYSQNREFDLGALSGRPLDASPYADVYVPVSIDMPQRFGDAPFTTIDLGQSSIQLNGRGMRVGVSTENMWWGPGIESSILMSNSAAGFEHLFLGTERPLDVKLGNLEALFTLGRLGMSDYVRSDFPDSARARWLTALGFTFQPRGAPGLYLGGMRVFQAYFPREGLSFGDVAAVFEPFTKSGLITDEDSTGLDTKDQLVSIFGRWVFPESGFEVYGEFARNDHSMDVRDLVLEPGHASGFLLGAQKAFRQDGGVLRVGAEMTSLPSGLTRLVRSAGGFYTHGQIRQGYTHRGQLLGSSAGPGGVSQVGRLDWYRRWGMVGAFVQRQEQNRDVYYSRFRGAFNRHYHDVFLGFGLRGGLTRGPVVLNASLLRQTEFNRYFELRNDVTNMQMTMTAEVVVH